MSDSGQSHELQPDWLLCPWNSPGKSTGVGCHCLVQEYRSGLQFPYSGDLPNRPRNQARVSCIAGKFFTVCTTREASLFDFLIFLLLFDMFCFNIICNVSCLLSGFSHVQLVCDPMDGSPPVSSAREIFQTRILEWVAISFPRGSNPHLLHCRHILYQLSYQIYLNLFLI